MPAVEKMMDVRLANCSYGRVVHYGKEAKEAESRNMVLVEHTVLPQSFEINPAELTPVDPDYKTAERKNIAGYFFGYSECSDYASLSQILHDIRNSLLPKDKLRVGHTFSVGVGDGYAYYVVTKVAKVNCTVEWRGFCPDNYRDGFFGFGGTFRVCDVARMAGVPDRSSVRIFSEPTVENYLEALEWFKNKYGITPDLPTDKAGIDKWMGF